VNDADDHRVAMKWFLSSFGYAVESARSAEEALSLFDSKTHDLVVTDHPMRGMTGAELAHIVKLRSPETPVLMCSGRPPSDQSAIDLIVPKPAPMLLLKEGVDRLLLGEPIC